MYRLTAFKASELRYFRLRCFCTPHLCVGFLVFVSVSRPRPPPVRTTLSRAIFHNTIFHAQLCHTQSFTTQSFTTQTFTYISLTHNFVTRNVSQSSHTFLPHTIFHNTTAAAFRCCSCGWLNPFLLRLHTCQTRRLAFADRRLRVAIRRHLSLCLRQKDVSRFCILSYILFAGLVSIYILGISLLFLCSYAQMLSIMFLHLNPLPSMGSVKDVWDVILFDFSVRSPNHITIRSPSPHCFGPLAGAMFFVLCKTASGMSYVQNKVVFPYEGNDTPLELFQPKVWQPAAT